MMRLYVSARSPFVREVLVALCELGLAGTVELIPVAVRMDQPNATVLANNPLGKIPALVLDDGSTVGGTLPIIDELDRQAGGNLLPAARLERSWHLRHQAISHGLLEVLVLWRNERDKPPAQQTAGWIVNFETKAASTLDTLERSIAEVAAAEFGLAHVSLAALMFYLDFRFATLEWRSHRPMLSAWAADTAERPSVREAAALCEAM
jgi:glutathione S-transferase